MEKEKIIVDFNEMPEATREMLIRATLKAVREFKAQPGGKEYLDKRTEERRRRNAAKKLNSIEGGES